DPRAPCDPANDRIDDGGRRLPPSCRERRQGATGDQREMGDDETPRLAEPPGDSPEPAARLREERVGEERAVVGESESEERDGAGGQTRPEAPGTGTIPPDKRAGHQQAREERCFGTRP